jgi:hypothetical protein
VENFTGIINVFIYVNCDKWSGIGFLWGKNGLDLNVKTSFKGGSSYPFF